MTPSLVTTIVCVLAFLAPSLSFKSSPRLPSGRPRKNINISTSWSSLVMVTGSRAEYLRSCAAAIIAVATTQRPAPSSATTPTTVVNSVLAGYGVPMISDEGKFTSSYITLDDGGQRTVCAFAFPANWVEAKKRDGMTAANYQSGDGLVFSVGSAQPAKAVRDISARTIVAESTPSGGVVKILQEDSVSKGGVNYTYLTVKYNTVTRSGYDVERISYIAATVTQRKLFTLVATTSSDRRNKMDVDLMAIRASFRVGDAGVVEDSG